MLVSRYAATFAGTPEQVSLARNHIWDYLADCPVADDACLIVSEFASNAVRHSLSRVGMFTVRCERFSTYVWVEVEDEGGDWCRPEPDGRPHGLDIVSLLAGENGWGIEQASDGMRVVWARLELSLRVSSLRSSWAIVRPRETARLTPTSRAVAFRYSSRRNVKSRAELAAASLQYSDRRDPPGLHWGSAPD